MSGSSVDRPVLSDRVLFLERGGVRLSRNRLESEDVLLEEGLLDEVFQVSSESPAVDSLVPLIVVVRAVHLCPRQQQIGLNGLLASDPWLNFESIEDFIDWELQWSKTLCRPVALDWT